MSKKRLDTKELVAVTKKSAGKKLVKIAVFLTTVHVVVKVVSEVVNKMNQVDKASEEDGDILKYSVIFAGRNIKIDDEPFKGAVINNICAGIKLDLSSARIEEDVDIHCKNLMSGISIIVPKKVNVDITGKSIFSSVTNSVPKVDVEIAPTIHIYVDNIMSGMEVNVKKGCGVEGSKYCEKEEENEEKENEEKENEEKEKEEKEEKENEEEVNEENKDAKKEKEEEESQEDISIN